MESIIKFNKSLSTSFILLLTIVSFNTFAKTGNHQDLVNQAIRASGVDQQFAIMDQIFTEIINQSFAANNNISNEYKEKIKTIMTSNFSNNDFMDQITKSISNNLSDEELNSQLSIYKDPLVTKFTQAEVARSSPEAMRDLSDFASRLDENPPSKERLALVERLDKATETTKSTKIMVLNILKTMAKTMNDLDPLYTDEKINQIIDHLDGIIELALAESVKVRFLFIYQDFTDKEIEYYNKIIENNTAFRKFNNAVLTAVNDYFDDYVKRVGKELFELAKAKNQSAQMH